MKFELTEKQEKLFEFVKEMHGNQKRKYTGEPYWNHPYDVAKRVSIINKPEAIEIALCHDLFEDTDCDYTKLFMFLVSIGYSTSEGMRICKNVDHLTDKYTKEVYPKLNREQRKHKEAIRLGQVNYIAQSVKYADMIDNTTSIVEHDKKFAKIYLKEKINLLDNMRYGNVNLLIDCCAILKRAMLDLKWNELSNAGLDEKLPKW